MNRFHELDALRAFAMLLGVVLHSLLFLMPDPYDLWPVQEAWATEVNTETNPYVHLYLLIHGFRMPVFFLLSGFFTAMLWQRRGWRALTEHRLKRIALPLAVSAVTVIPVCAWIYSALEPQHFGEFSLLYWPLAWLNGFVHLWFLWQLLLIGALFLVLVRLGLTFTSPAWWLLVPLTALVMFLMNEPVVGPDTSQTVIPAPDVVGFYVLFFLFGVFYYQRGIATRRWWVWLLLPALAAYGGALAALAPVISDLRESGGEVVTRDLWGGAWALTAVLQAAYAWLMCFGTMGLFLIVASRERAWVRYVSDSSYWVYLWHLPLIIGGQWLLLSVNLSVHLKFVLIFAGVVGLLLVVYHLGVRYTPIGTMLNGKRTRPGRRPPPASAPNAPAAGTPG